LRIHSLSLGFVRAYLVETPAGLLLVDCGMPGSEKAILATMKSLGRRDMQLIFLTHAHVDHAGSAAALQRLTGAPLAIGRQDAPALASGWMPARGRRTPLRLVVDLCMPFLPVQPARPDFLLDDGDPLPLAGLPARIVHLPGHTPGSCGLELDGHTGGPIGFLGDLVSSRLGLHLQHHIIADQAALQASFRRIRDLGLALAYPGHGSRPLTGLELSLLVDRRLARTMIK
jgi:hydroxyacylglutathione hydrolase